MLYEVISPYGVNYKPIITRCREKKGPKTKTFEKKDEVKYEVKDHEVKQYWTYSGVQSLFLKTEGSNDGDFQYMINVQCVCSG